MMVWCVDLSGVKLWWFSQIPLLSALIDHICNVHIIIRILFFFKDKSFLKNHYASRITSCRLPPYRFTGTTVERCFFLHPTLPQLTLELQLKFNPSRAWRHVKLVIFLPFLSATFKVSFFTQCLTWTFTSIVRYYRC